LEFSSPSRRIFIGSHSLPPSLVRRIGPSEDAAEQYLSYKLIDSNQDWKAKWFYVTNHHSGLPKPSGKQPKHRPWWNSEPTMQEGI
jgi:hypothetical protein